MKWQPPPRPEWAARMIEHGNVLGGAQHLVSLDGEDLIRAAMTATGLTDFGRGDWRQHFDTLVRALEEESNLHLVGRILTRTEIVRALANRLKLAALWSESPRILAENVEAPVFIVGSPRSGTSILHELMAQDPASRVPLMWEMNHPVEALAGEDVAESADMLQQFWHNLQPEYETMHANSGYLPNECIFITLHEFLSDHWGGSHNVPSYDRYLQKADQRPAFRYHKDFLKTLQKRGASKRWLLKAPSHIFQLQALFDVYPDARVVRTHRDPLKTLASSLSLMGTLKWMRCNEVDMSKVPGQLAFGYAYAYQREIEQRASGELPDAQFIDVQFEEIVKDPVATIEGVYARLGWPIDDTVRTGVGDYAKYKPKGSRGAHAYSIEESGLDAAVERERYGFYMERYGIKSEEG